MRTSLLWTKFLFSDKIEKYILVHVMIKLIKWDGTLSDEANFLLLYIYISCEVNKFSTLTVESTPRPVRALNCSLNYMLPISNDVVSSNARLKKKRGGGSQTISLELNF